MQASPKRLPLSDAVGIMIFILWDWSLEGPKLHECPWPKQWELNLYRRYRTDVHEYTCFDGGKTALPSLYCLTNTGVNTSKAEPGWSILSVTLKQRGKNMSGEELHSYLDEIERIHGLYSPAALGLAAAIACCGFTFLLGGGPVEMFCAFIGAGLGNFLRCKLTKHHFTLFLGIVTSVSLACFVYAGLLKLGEILFGISIQHEAGYICAMLFYHPWLPLYLPAESTWQSWICVLVWKGLLMH